MPPDHRAEVLGRYSNLGPSGVRLRKAHEAAQEHRRPEPWKPPAATITTVRRMTEAEISAMVTDYRAGIGSWQLARKYRVSDTTVLDRLRAAGVDIADVQRRRIEERAAITQEMRCLREAGCTPSEIGEKFGLTRQAVWMRLGRAAGADPVQTE